MKRKRADQVTVEEQALTPSKRRTGKRTSAPDPSTVGSTNDDELLTGTIKLAPATPKRSQRTKDTPTPSRTADQSARRKSSRKLLERLDVAEGEDDELAGEETLAQRILRGADPDDLSASDEESSRASEAAGEDAVEVQTPSKRPRGRPRKPKTERKRTPTPPRDLPAHEHYFFQNRPGGIKTSNNTLVGVPLLTHEEYFEVMKDYKDPHEEDVDFLHDIHGQSYEQWSFELQEGFSICLHGYGSKRRILDDFAQYLHEETEGRTKIIVISGYAEGFKIGYALAALASAIPGLEDERLSANPPDAASTILGALDKLSNTTKDTASDKPPPNYLLLVHSLDAPALRRPPTQSVLARLAAHPSISLLASTNTPNFPLLWDHTLRQEFNWLFHDATTFVPYDVEISGGDSGGGGVVDAVNALLGRSGRKVHGKEGVVFVLRSLTESARRLYRLLVAEVLSADMDEDGGVLEQRSDDDDDGDDEFETAVSGRRARARGRASGVGVGVGAGIEHRSLYRKAVAELIATNEIQFRQLLKEFYDHEMLVSRKDAVGTETLSLPFRREECEAILEDLTLEE